MKPISPASSANRLSRRELLKAGVAALPIAYGLSTGLATAAETRAVPHYEEVVGWEKIPAGLELADPNGVAIDEKGRILTAAGGRKNPVLVFDPDGQLVDTWGRGILGHKHELKIYHNKVYLCDIDLHQVYEFSLDGELLRSFGQRGVPGDGKDQFNRPTDLAVGPGGDFYITDGYGNSRVVVLSPEGKFKFAWGTKGDQPGQFDRPHGIVIDQKNRVYVNDRKNNRIQRFDLDGKFIDQWTNVGKPFGTWLTDDGLVYVGDGTFDGPFRILILDQDGNLLHEFKVPATPHSLTIDAQGNLFTTECDHALRVRKYTPKKA